jgi:hypothetical protein
MREFIKKRLNEDLEYYYVDDSAPEVDEYKMGMNESRGDNLVAYHGSQHKIKKFTDKFVGGAEANDQEGPGIYFTTIPEEAKQYAVGGGYLYKVNLTINKLVSNEENFDLDYLTKPITQLIKMAPNWKRVAKGYDDDIEEGLNEMIHRYIGMSMSEKEVFVGLYGEVYKSNPIAYVRNMTKLGYGGVNLPTKSGGAHIAIYDTSLINLIGSKQID